MSHKKILVIDDSATIRKLVDTHLSAAGYELFLAPTAEDGLRMAEDVRPDLILLDHQLPGTTGYEVCCRLCESPVLKLIPVVVSSTLRNRAYAEYTEMSNVVDMLPKPYTEELLRTTVANALETAAMIVASQTQGTAVPEVIATVGDTDLAGSFAMFGLREVLDFLNNGNKSGVLEVEAERTRIWFYLKEGSIQGVSATGLREQEVERITAGLPQAIENLAPVLKLTLEGRSGAEVDGFLQLLNRKVLDPRLVTRLLLYQAAMLVRLAFTRRLTGFRFEAGRAAPAMYRSLPLDISLLALLVEGAVHDDPAGLPVEASETTFVRRAIRGQNLDRAGLAPRHMKILGLLSEPRTVAELAGLLQWEPLEVRQVLNGFEQAELVQTAARSEGARVVVFESDPRIAQHLRTVLAETATGSQFKVVRDRLALQLFLKRARPEVLVFAAEDSEACTQMRELLAAAADRLSDAKYVLITTEAAARDAADVWRKRLGVVPHQILARPSTTEQLLAAVEKVLEKVAKEPSREVASPQQVAPARAVNPAPAAAASAVANPVTEPTAGVQ
ncbi:response regulator [Candidatus Laterigemmans baculatus]|uniref:response regulator n=1 Tax=Candidatus Laterigemmans baculatus TaxID=2770505 RepID=UPI0013DAD63B|nr:response regulator [Candidatus Laterigemmans baculatus]